MHGPDDAYYRRVRNWSSTPAYRTELRALATALQLKAHHLVLDVGCGTGRAMQILALQQVRLVGLDRSQTWHRHCPSRPVVQADAASLPFPDGLFDVVLLVHVMAHLIHPAKSLQEIRRVLRGGGRLGVLTPNARFLAALRQSAAAAHGYIPDPTVESHFTLEELQTLIHAAGFALHLATTWGKGPAGQPQAPTQRATRRPPPGPHPGPWQTLESEADAPGTGAQRERLMVIATAAGH